MVIAMVGVMVKLSVMVRVSRDPSGKRHVCALRGHCS